MDSTRTRTGRPGCSILVCSVACGLFGVPSTWAPRGAVAGDRRLDSGDTCSMFVLGWGRVDDTSSSCTKSSFHPRGRGNRLVGSKAMAARHSFRVGARAVSCRSRSMPSTALQRPRTRARAGTNADLEHLDHQDVPQRRVHLQHTVHVRGPYGAKYRRRGDVPDPPRQLRLELRPRHGSVQWYYGRSRYRSSNIKFVARTVSCTQPHMSEIAPATCKRPSPWRASRHDPLGGGLLRSSWYDPGKTVSAGRLEIPDITRRSERQFTNTS